MNRLQQLVAQSIVHETIVRRSGGTCDYYVDSARLLYHPELVALAAERMLDIAYAQEATHVGGEATSALPLVGAILTLSHTRGRPLRGFMIRKQPKSYGRSGLIEGDLPDDSRILLVDDVTGLASAAKRCCKVLKEHNHHVVGYSSIVDRQETARDVLNSLGVGFFPLFGVDELQEASV